MSDYKANILIVEDDENLGFVIKDYLEMLHYKVDWQKDGIEGINAYKSGQNQIDLCLLDIMLPYKDGYGVAEEIRRINQSVPIIFLTAKQMLEDKIKGFRLGADDYITKPFSSEELCLRIDAILRRSKGFSLKNQEQSVFQVGKYTFDYENRTLILNNEHRHLTNKEAEVLKALVLNCHKIIRRDQVLKAIWGQDDYFMGRSMDVYISKLRKYLKDDENVSITNIHSTGFKLEIKE